MLTRSEVLLLAASGAMRVATNAAAPAALPSAPAHSHVDPRAIFRAATSIHSANGIAHDSFVRLGGIEQWISIRSQHKSNPILLFLHGGPGFTSIPTSYFYMRGWDEFFTVVQWDQRGAGKTYAANDPRVVERTMTIDRMVEDTLELTNWLRNQYGQDRIFIAAHSWGTALGMHVALKAPHSLHAYIGMQQAIDFSESERLGFQSTLQAAEADHNAEAARELRAIDPFPDPSPTKNLKKLPVERKWLEYFDGDAIGTHEEVDQFSPDYTAADLVARDKGLDFSFRSLWGQLFAVDFSKVHTLQCPVVFMHGRKDFTCSPLLLAKWYDNLQAPSKKLVWFEDSAHMITQEQPGRVLVTLAGDALSLVTKG